MPGEKSTDALYALVKTKLEEDGILRRVRCMLQANIVSLIKGGEHENTAIVQRPLNGIEAGNGKVGVAKGGGGGGGGGGGDKVVNGAGVANKGGIQRDVRIRLLNQLILEYFKWCGFAYSAAMLARESDIENVVPKRDCLEGMLGRARPQHELPILLEIVADLYEEKRTQQT